MILSRVLLLTAFALPVLATPHRSVSDAQAFIDNAEAELLKIGTMDQRAGWVHENFITGDTELLAANQHERVIGRITELIGQSKEFEGLNLPPELRRKFLLLKLALPMPGPKDARLREELTQVASSLDGMYGKGKYCPGPNQPCLGIDELEQRLARSRDANQIREMWVGWHKIGAPMRDKYARFVQLSNQGAREIGFAHTAVLWRSRYDMPPEQFSADIERLWQQVEPLYRELHAYVRAKLVQKYGAIAERRDGLIPADLLGNMWAQEWGNIYDIVAPSGASPTYDIGAILTKRNTTARQLVAYGEKFFRSLGLQKLPDTFWERSLFVRPADRDVVCHASSWDIDFDLDVRLKTCLHGTSDDFITVHHELGHTYYDLAYRKQPLLFRGGANDGFHEAIGDAIALSITPEYLKRIGLIDQVPPPSSDLPLLLRTALDKIAFLPFGLMIDKWRWDVFSGQVQPTDYNRRWWTLRERYQGVAPPVNRTDDDFDPGAKYHIPSNTPYVRYFLARIYQFQFYRAMCRAAGYTGPLNRCSFYESKAAGDKLEAMLSLGASKPWPEALKAVAGEDRADASAMMEYFKPLLTWLRDENKRVKIGWTVAVDPMDGS